MDLPDAHRQRAAAVRFDWGQVGAAAIAGPDTDVVVVVDVLSFTTTATVALDLGATVVPLPWNDAGAAALAADQGAVLAVGRTLAGDEGISLSPASVRAHAKAGTTIVLPSPNGAALCHQVSRPGGPVCVAASLRNATAVATWIDQRALARVAVIAAGERWPDGSLRPALEDLWGAGRVVAALSGGRGLSPEATAAAGLAGSLTAHDAGALLSSTASGIELVERGYAEDVAIAAEVDATDVVPCLRDGVFVIG